ncbi:hypothetical protein J4225_04115 [Candidatus Pacearchaeota archaeon]|nr:hypothetical protein [Candidatus Pacearchaeota archaeon]
MGLFGKFYVISNWFNERKQKKLELEKKREEERQHNEMVQRKLQEAVNGAKPKLEEVFMPSVDIVDSYYYDLSPNAKKRVRSSLQKEQEKIYSKITAYDLRAIQYRERTGRLSDIERKRLAVEPRKREYFSREQRRQILRENYALAA